MPEPLINHSPETMREADEILITDDNPENLEVLSRVLEPEGYSVRVALTGEQAKESIQVRCPDLIIMDIQLPGIDGFQVCRWLRSQGSIPDIPLIFLSAAADVHHKKQAFEAGGNDYITKPFQTYEILARVKTQLDAFKFQSGLIERNAVLLKQFQGAFDQAAVGIAHLQPESGAFIECNQRLLDLLGYSPGEMLGISFKDLVHPNSKNEALGHLQQLYDSTVSESSFEAKYIKKDGAVAWCLINLSMVRLQAANISDYCLAIVEDITERKRMEEELSDALSELRQLKDRVEAENVSLREEIRVTRGQGKQVCDSDVMKALLHQAEIVAATDTTVLITGETGTGKELLARTIHEQSSRKDKPLVIVNCAAIPHNLIESELFGRTKGAFSGAHSPQIGRFEMAHGGTLFLDEIGELPTELQPKLLRALQEGEFQRLGSPKTTKVDVRVLAATNRDLEEMINSGEFREDLYYRLNVFPLSIPPLRERRDDIPGLVRNFVSEFNKKMGKHITTIPKESMNGLTTHDWPGNARELRNAIERAMIVSQSSSLEIASLPAFNRSEAVPVEKSLDEVQRRHILTILEENNWKIRGTNGAAKILGVPPSTLESRMVKLGIKRPSKPSA